MISDKGVYYCSCSFVITVMAYFIDPTENKLIVAFGQFVTYVVCIIPKVINGVSIKILLLNKLKIPLSAVDKYFGSVKKGMSNTDSPFEKKLVNTYNPIDLRPCRLKNF